MLDRRLLTPLLALLLHVSLPLLAWAAGGTAIVAAKGQPAYVPEGWPKGAGELVNDPMRTSGWNDWFSEWPNDVNHYAFEIRSMDDLNRLITKLASIKTGLKQVRLSFLKEPNGLGWVTKVDAGNKIPILFSIGDQDVIDTWYKRVRKPFGVMEFTAAPVAVPPTLTIFVQHDAVNLEELEIPDGIEVVSGYVPRVFHRFNTTLEKEREKKPVEPKPGAAQPKLDAKSQAINEKIEVFLEKRKGSSN